LRLDLNGDWDFIVDPDGSLSLESLGTESEWRRIRVPFCWESQFPDLRNYAGVAWYSRKFNIPNDFLEGVVLLWFGAVDYFCEVWINKNLVDSHEGGFTPFAFEVQDFLRVGENEIVVRVVDPSDDVSRFPDFTFEEIPHGKQRWYIRVSGIWQDVWLEARPKPYIKNLIATPDVDGGRVKIKAVLSHPDDKGELRFTVTSPGGEVVGEKIIPINASGIDYQEEIEIRNPVLWSSEQPALYTVRVEITGVSQGDSVSSKFGMRKIEARDGLVYLNDRPIYILGALDQDFYPETIYTPPSTEYLRDQFVKAKELGLNLLRCHIKVPDPRYLDLADELGMLVWYEVPSWVRLTSKTKERVQETIKEMFERDYNHPSIIIFSITNEGWGVDLFGSEEHRQWLAEMYDYVKNLNPNVLVVDNSDGPFHVKTDLDDVHCYFSIPDHYENYKNWLNLFSTDPSWSWSPHGDAERRGWEPLILSEFGNWGLPSLKAISTLDGEPWWFGMVYAEDENSLASGVEARFREWGLERVFGSFEDFAIETQHQEFNALKYEIEEIRKYGNIAGYIITELTDLYWESNGLLDFHRNPKVFHKQMAIVQAQDVVIPDWSKVNYCSGEDFEMEILVSHFSELRMQNYSMEWSLEGFDIKNVIGDINIESGEVKSVGRLGFKMPEVTTPIKTRLNMLLKTPLGDVVASNYMELNIFPRVHPDIQSLKIWVYDPQGRIDNLVSKLEKAGFSVTTKPEPEIDLVLASVIDKNLVELLGDRGRVLLLASVDSISVPTTIKVVDRSSKGRWGDWISSFSYVDPRILKGIPTERKLCGFDFYRCIPKNVLEVFKPADLKDILSGVFVGWLNSPGLLIGQFTLSGIKVLACTFDLTETFGEDPVSTILLGNLIEYTANLKGGNEN
jgi:hypothetical protein